MENDSVGVILMAVVIVSVLLLLVLKLVQFINGFRRRKRYLLIEMNRAGNDDEYRFWHRELRCHYLYLIPFVTERNVMRVYRLFFHESKHAAKEKRSDGLMHILAPSMLAICICAICLCGASWAWFTASTSTGTTAIRSSSYKLLYQAEGDTAPIELSGTKTVTVPESGGSYKVTLKAAGTTGATGYCSITVGSETYYTEQISVQDTVAFSFGITATAGTEIILTPKWGTYSGAATIQNGEDITATGAQPGNAQTSVTDEPSAAPTAPTAPTTPGSSPAESETTASEPAAPAPDSTQPESTDTEPSSAPETTTPENTTAVQTEPPTTEERENN